MSFDINDDLLYRGEGNSSIVIALKNKSKVIRLLKKDGKLMRSSVVARTLSNKKNCDQPNFTRGTSNCSQRESQSQHPLRNIQFMHLIMRPLTSPFMSEALELVHLKSEFINKISKKVEAERPFHRLDKTLHLDDQYALIMDDLCALPQKLTKHLDSQDLIETTFSIEIKPKQGFLPQLNRLVMKSSINDPICAQIKGHCLYGLTQHLKILRGRIAEESDYCPINLFSGCPIKMKYALEALLVHPQNNLRIFKDLTLAYGETNQQKLSSTLASFFHHDTSQNLSIDTRDRFINILIQCLLSEPGSINNNCDNLDPKYKDNENLSSNIGNNDGCLQHLSVPKCRRCDYSTNSLGKVGCHKLPESCVLTSVLRAQRLDTIGPFEARHMLEWLLENAISSDSDRDVLEELGKPRMPTGFGSSAQLPTETKRDYYFRKVWEFLVSLTAKDCSIMITMCRINPDCLESVLSRHPEVQDHLLREAGTNNHYLFNVGVADFDQKMPMKIMKICDNLQQIVSQTRFSENLKKEISIHTKKWIHKTVELISLTILSYGDEAITLSQNNHLLKD